MPADIIKPRTFRGLIREAGQYGGNGWEWSGLFPLYCGAVLVVGYMWLGACWLYWRTVDDLQRRSGRQARALAIVTMMLLADLVIWTARLDAQYTQRLSNRLIWLPAAMSVSPWAFEAAGIICRSLQHWGFLSWRSP